MWYGDPDMVLQQERVRQEELIRRHQERQALRQQQGNRGMVRTMLGHLGDAMVGAGERLRRSSQKASEHSIVAPFDRLAF